jgi:hypothetical protein
MKLKYKHQEDLIDITSNSMIALSVIIAIIIIYYLKYYNCIDIDKIDKIEL